MPDKSLLTSLLLLPLLLCPSTASAQASASASAGASAGASADDIEMSAAQAPTVDTWAQIWPQWRGPQRNAEVTGDDWPETLEGLTEQWRVPLGKGYPGPIVSETRVFVAGTENGDTEVVNALDRRTGQILWTASWPGKGTVPFFAAANGDWIRATPAYDGETLYVGGMNELLVALDAETGEERWRVDFPARFSTKVPDFGFASSPLVDGDALFVQAANSLVKLNKRTGETLWRRLESQGDIMMSGAFSSPVLTDLAGRRQLLVLTRVAMHGLDPETGDELWGQELPSFRGMHILTPAVWGDSVFTSPSRERSYLLSLAEQPAATQGTHGSLSAEQTWTHKSTAYMSSPVVIDDHIYMHLGNGRLTCIDLRDGTDKWTTQSMGKYWSLTWQDDQILGLNEAGELFLVRATPESFQLQDRREVAQASTWGHVAVAGEQVFVRELEAIVAFRWPR